MSKNSSSSIRPKRIEYKFYCELCDLFTTSKPALQDHFEGQKHKNAKRRQKEEEKLKRKLNAENDNNSEYVGIVENEFGYACELCHCNCTSISNVQTHINGRLHRQNLNYFLNGNRKMTRIEIKLKNESPVVGLDFVCEYFNKRAPELNRFYICSLCDFKFQEEGIIQHIMGLDHQFKLLREYNETEYLNLFQKNLAPSSLSVYVKTWAVELERKYGRGVPKLSTIKWTTQNEPMDIIDITEDEEPSSFTIVAPKQETNFEIPKGETKSEMHEPESNSEMHEPESNSEINEPESNSEKIHKPESNSEKIHKPESNSEEIHKPESNSEIHEPESNSEEIHKPESSSEIHEPESMIKEEPKEEIEEPPRKKQKLNHFPGLEQFKRFKITNSKEEKIALAVVKHNFKLLAHFELKKTPYRIKQAVGNNVLKHLMERAEKIIMELKPNHAEPGPSTTAVIENEPKPQVQEPVQQTPPPLPPIPLPPPPPPPEQSEANSIEIIVSRFGSQPQFVPDHQALQPPNGWVPPPVTTQYYYQPQPWRYPMMQMYPRPPYSQPLYPPLPYPPPYPPPPYLT